MAKDRFESAKTQTDIDAIDGWTTEENLYSGTYGNLYGTANPSIKMATLRWAGNTTAPSNDKITVNNLDAKYVPKLGECIATLRKADMIRVNSNAYVEISLATTNWSAGSITYPTA